MYLEDAWKCSAAVLTLTRERCAMDDVVVSSKGVKNKSHQISVRFFPAGSMVRC